MKLYTEEQLTAAYFMGNMDGFLNNKDYSISERFEPIELPSDEEMVSIKNVFEFAEWMSSLINSNYKSNGNWYYNKEIYTTKQLYEKWMRNKIQGGNK